MIAGNTIDDFVQGVLERKGRLVTAVVDGTAMAPELSGDVLDELQRIVRQISSELTAQDLDSDDIIDRLLHKARTELDEHRTPESGVAVRTPEEIEAFRRALGALARALSPPVPDRYRFASASHPGVEYELTIDGADVICTCPGFEYRGQCRHARDLKAIRAAGQPVPAEYSKVG
jgi:hypothetical protein